MSHAPLRVVICGAGVIGAAIAYYLSRRGVAATVVERCEVACAASGKAGGFLALDWYDGSPLSALARTSFSLHAQLPQILGADYGYRRLTTLAVAARAQGGRGPACPTVDDLAWLDGSGVAYRVLGTPTTTAQVHPEKFTRALLHAACTSGAQLRIGCVQGLEVQHGQVCGVRVDGEIFPADVVVIAMGPWSGSAAAWVPIPPVMGLKGHSITMRPTTPIPAQALFVIYVTETGEQLEPEVYPRPDGEVYLCALSDMSPLPTSPELVQPRPDAGPLLQRIAGTLSSALMGLQPQRIQACYRPVTEDGLPFLGRVPGVTGAYITTGHSCWGILNAPASGLAMAELIVDGEARSVDLTPFDPQRALAVRHRRVVSR
jgi:glycine/D-amino acid oxidase-like deaminating enzyme